MNTNTLAPITATGFSLLAAGAVFAQPIAHPAGPAQQIGWAQEIVLKASNTPDDFNHPGPNYNIFNPSQTDDHAIYYSAGDWLRDPDTDLFLDGFVDFVGSYGMVFGNYYFDYDDGYDRQVKHLQEYMLAPAYDAGLTAASLRSATVTLVVDRVIEMSLSGCTDCWAPEWMYVNVFAGNGSLASVGQAQIDFDRCDRLLPGTWDTVVHLLSDRGERLSDDEIDFYGGKITIQFDVTEEVRGLLAAGEPFAGLTLAGSHDGDFTMMSIDGGMYPGTTLPTLTLVSRGLMHKPLPMPRPGPGGIPEIQPVPSEQYAFGDINHDGLVDRADRARFIDCYLESFGRTASECSGADMDMDGDIDSDDLSLFVGFFGR